MANDLAFEQKADARPDTESCGLKVPVICIVVNSLCCDALKQVFLSLPADLQSVTVIIQHFPEGQAAADSKLLKLDADMDEIVDGTEVRPGRILLSPSGRTVQIENGRFRFGEESAMSPADVFLSSLAEQYGSELSVIVFTDTGMDEMRGVQEVAAGGGVVLVCIPEKNGKDALFSTSVNCGPAAEMTPEEIAEEIVRISAEGRVQHPLSRRDLSGICKLISEKTGLKIQNYKSSVVQRRVARRMLVSNLSSPEDYTALLTQSPAEVRSLASDLMIGVTSFFRDASAWDVLRDRVLSLLVSKDSKEPLRVWNPACATGEETYSLAMLLKHEIDRSGRSRPVQIFATDACESSLERARSGKYANESMSSLPEGYAASYFVPSDDSGFMLVSKAIRDMVVFAKQDVLSDPPFSKVDLIVCRNLLIYLNSAAQERCLETFRYALKEGCFLFLGNAETVGKKDSSFIPFEAKNCRIYRKNCGTKPVRLPLHLLSFEAAASAEPQHSDKEDCGLVSSIQESLLENFAPAAVAVNRQYEILYTSGRVNRYICFPRGTPTYNLLDLLPEEARNSVRGAIYSLLHEDHEAFHFTYSSDNNDNVFTTVRRVDECDEVFLVVFEKCGEADIPEAIESEEPDQVQMLRNELSATQEDLNRHIEQLKILNEEMQSSNEELQAANEELETSREELQSLNEELITVNSQLQMKVEEQEETNNDLINFLSSTNIPTLFLDNQLRIRRFTPALKRLIGFMPSDAGRSVRDFYLSKLGEGFLKDVEKVRTTLVPVKKEIPIENSWFIRSVQPYRTADDHIDGVVVSFADVSRLKSAYDDLKAGAEKFRIVADFTCDWEYWRGLDNTFLYITPSCQRVTGYGREEFLNDPELYFRIIHPDDREKMRNHTVNDICRNAPCEIEFRIIRHDGELRWISHLCQPVFDKSGVCLGRRSSNRDITDRKRMEQSLRESHKDLKHAQKVARMGSWKLNVKTKELVWSEETYRIFGIPQGSAVSYEQFMSAVHPEDREYVDRKWNEAAQSRSYEIEHRILVDNQIKWVFQQADLSYGEDRQLQFVFGTVQDISERKEYEHLLLEARRLAEERAREAEEGKRTLEAIMEYIPQGITVADAPDGKVRMISRFGLEMSGRGEEEEAGPGKEFRGLDLYQLDGGRKVEFADLPLTRAVKGETVRGKEYLLKRPDGTSIVISAQAGPVRDSRGRIIGGVSGWYDVSERKKLEVDLRKSEERFRGTFENAAVGIAHVGLQGEWLDVNGRMCEIVGYSRQELLYLTFQDITHADDLDKDMDLVRKTTEGEISGYRMEKRYVRKNGEPVWVLLTVSCIRDSGGNVLYFISVVEDISERKKAEEELVKRAEELASMNRELESFSYSVSHDLRSPLRAITGFSSFLEEDYGDRLDDTGKGYLKKVREGVHKMGALIDDLLSLSRVSRLELVIQDIDLGSMVCSIVAELRHAEPDREVEVVVEEGLRLRGDARLMQIALSNLMGNAWKFTRKTPNAKIEVGSEKGTENRRFFIKDNGAGFDNKYGEKMFAPFQRLHSDADFPGTGIGLAIVERIIHRHGGRVWAQGERGTGAVFRFSLE